MFFWEKQGGGETRSGFVVIFLLTEGYVRLDTMSCSHLYSIISCLAVAVGYLK